MSYDPEFDELMTDTVTLHPRGRANEYGVRPPGAPFDLRGHLMGGAHEVAGSGGASTVAAGQIILAGYYPAIQPEWKIAVPGEGLVPILGIEHVSDDDGPHHSTVHYGAAVS